MTRKTFPEHAQTMQIAELTAQLRIDRATIANHLRVNELMQTEVARLRKDTSETQNLREQIDKLTQELADNKSFLTYHRENAIRALNELEQAHSILDCLGEAPSRSYRSDDSSCDRQRSVAARLAGAFLAIAKNSGAL